MDAGHRGRTHGVRALIVMYLALVPAAVNAETSPVRLFVQGVAEAPCATKSTLRARVANLLERDPFSADARRRIQVRFGTLEDGLKADIGFREADDQPEARRTLRTHGRDCEALLGAVALSVVLAVDPVRGLSLVGESPSLDLDAPTAAEMPNTRGDEAPPAAAPESEPSEPKAARAAPGSTSEPAPPDATALPPSATQVTVDSGAESDTAPEPGPGVIDLESPDTATPVMHDGIIISGGLVGGLGSGLGADLAAHLDWTVDIGPWAFGTYLRWAPNFGFAHLDGTVEADLTTFGVHLCRRWGPWTGCTLGSGGVQYARGVDGNFDPAKRIDAPYLAAGARGALQLWSAGPMDVSVSLEVFAPLSRLRILAQGTEVWATPPVSGHMGLSVGYVLP